MIEEIRMSIMEGEGEEMAEVFLYSRGPS